VFHVKEHRLEGGLFRVGIDPRGKEALRPYAGETKTNRSKGDKKGTCCLPRKGAEREV